MNRRKVRLQGGPLDGQVIELPDGTMSLTNSLPEVAPGHANAKGQRVTPHTYRRKRPDADTMQYQGVEKTE